MRGLRRQWIASIMLISGGLVVGLLLVEIGLRIAGVSYPSIYVPDKYRGLSLRPGAEMWWQDEGEAFTRINSQGLRDQEYTKAKPTNTFRIAVLGDSFTEARQVPMDHAFWAILERELSECEVFSQQQVEVINFGVSRYGTTEELLTLRHYVWDYSPDVVLLAWYANDVKDNSKALLGDPGKPYFVYLDGKLTLDSSFQKLFGYRIRQTVPARLLYQLIDHSRALQLANRVKNTVLKSIAGEDSSPDETLFVPGIEPIWKEPNDPAWREAWQITEDLLILMNDEVVKHSTQFMVVTLSYGPQVYPDLSVRQRWMEDYEVSDMFYPDSRIKALGKREGFVVLNLAQPLQAYAQENQVFLHGFENTVLGTGHWNSEGHRVAGEMIARKLCQVTR